MSRTNINPPDATINEYDLKVLANVHITLGQPETPSGQQSYKKLQRLGWIRQDTKKHPSRLTDEGNNALTVYLRQKNKEANKPV